MRLASACLHACIVAAVLSSCAMPLPPTGGPPDETPPSIESSAPETRAVNVETQTIRITFSEYVDEGAFSQAFSISPAPAEPPEIVWSGRTVEIRMPGEMRPNTTYIVTMDTELTDIRNVAVTSPITLAFSTGPTISAGSIAGRVVFPLGADPAAGVDVFAYALSDSTSPDSLPDRPAYRTQTDPSGSFTFDYLTEQFYYVAALRDQNRNYAPDAHEAFAPPPTPALFADSLSTPVEAPWILTRVDTRGPEPLRVQSFSTTRHALRLSEPVHFRDRDPNLWALHDSVSGAPAGVTSLYIQPNDPRQVLFTSPPLELIAHLVTPAALSDTSGNPVIEEAVTFTPSAAEDTLQLRFLGFLPAGASENVVVLPRGVEPGVRFNAPVEQERLEETVTVVDSAGTALAFAALTDDGTTYRVVPDLELSETGPIRISVDAAELAGLDSTASAVFQRLPRALTGELSGVVESPVGPVIVEAVPIEVELESEVPRYEVITDTTGGFFIPSLPAGTYRLRAYGDRNGDGRWSGGRIEPYVEPEPMTWTTEPIRVRARWETSLPDTLRIRDSQ